MDCTAREKKILLFLLNSAQPMTSEALAEEIGVSKRTIQRELEFIESYLEKRDLSLVKRKRSGLSIEGDPEKMEKTRQELLRFEQLDVSNIRQRRTYLLLELLRDRTPKKRIYFAHQLHVSESTISSDMEAIQKWMEKNRLKIIKKPGYGITFGGTEADYREALRRFIKDFMETDSVESDPDKLISALVETGNEGMYSLLNSNIIQKVERTLKQMNEPKLESLTEDAYISLILHIAISIMRIRQGGIVEKNQEVLANLEEYEGYDLAVRIVRTMELEFSLRIPKVEISYLLLHIEGSKLDYTRLGDREKDGSIDEEQILRLVDEMVKAFDPELASLLEEDESFVRGLLVHLRPVLVRLKNHMNIFNPLLTDIQREYPDVFVKCQNAAYVITKHTGFYVSDEEVGYLAMHFGSAVERLSQKNKYTRTVLIGVVCASGFGVARLMLTKLHNYLGDEGVHLFPFGKEDLGTSSTKDIDFFVTSFNLDPWNIDYIQVNPLISPSEIEQIQHKIEDYSHIHKKKVEIQQENTVDMSYLIGEINRLVNTFHCVRVPKYWSFDQVVEHLAVQITDDDWQKEHVVDTIQKREAMYTQVMPDIGIALLHGIVPKGIVETSIQLCVSEDLEAFLDPQFQGIHTIIMMMIPGDDHVSVNTELLGYISSSLVKNEHFLDMMLKGQKEEVREELRKVLQAYFFEICQDVIERK